MFRLSTMQNVQSWQRLVAILGWLVLGLLIVTTGVHAVSLVVEHTSGSGGLLYTIRILSPALTELFAALVAVGFAAHYWRADQRLYALLIEIIWLVFAGLNLVTSFAAETTTTLPAFLDGWLHYGLPLSALVTGALFYVVIRSDPDHKREQERMAAEEKEAMQLFMAHQDVLNSPAMANILTQQAWLNVVDDLRRRGFTDQQIGFMTAHVPELNSPTAPALPAPSAPTEEPHPVDFPSVVVRPSNGQNTPRVTTQFAPSLNGHHHPNGIE